MGELSKHFIDQFHTLPGITAKEKQQNLFKLLHKNRAVLRKNQEELEQICANLKPTNHLEKIFRIDFLIYYRQFQELYRECLNGDEIALSKIAKQEWFFREAFETVSAEEFVTEILPSISYAVKLKILRRLLVSEEKADGIFGALRKRYGIFLATVILPKCSSNKIRDALQSQLIKLTPSQLKLLYNKDPNLIRVYIKERVEHEGNSTFMNNNPVLVYIAQKDPELFTELFKKYKFNVSLGNRTTIMYIKSQKSNILDKSEAEKGVQWPEKYLQILKKGPLVRKLGGELKCLFFKPLVNTTDDLCWKVILQYYPKNQRFNLYKSVYDSTYYQKFGEDVDAINEDVLKIVTDHAERDRISKLKLTKEENDQYLSYVDSNYCLSEFKNRLSQMASATERSKFVRIVIECCILNDDLGALLEILKMVAVRFKNDGHNVCDTVTCTLENNEKILDRLGEQHWKYLMDIITKAKSTYGYVYYEVKMRVKFVEYLLRNNKPIKEALSKFPEHGVEDFEYMKVWKQPKICRTILCELIDLGLQKPEDEQDPEQYDCKLALICKKFNKAYPKEAINIHENERVLQSVKKVLEKHEAHPTFYEIMGINYMVCQKTSSALMKEIKRLYFENFETFGDALSCIWFLKHHPETLLENWDHFITNIIQAQKNYSTRLDQKRLWYLFKKYTHLGMDSKIVENFTTRLRKEDSGHDKGLAEGLTILASQDHVLKLIKSYVPTSASVDLTNDDVKNLYEVQCEFVKSLHYLNSPESVLDTALQFCKGDYLKSAQSPLYSSIYKLPETQVKAAVERLNKEKAVSVKKHALHLSCAVLDTTTTYEYLKTTSAFALTPSLKYLARNPSESLWEVVNKKLSNSDKADLQVIKWLSDITFPLEYASRYLEAAWTLVSKYESKEIKKILINRMHENVIQKLHPQFVYKIIEESVFKVEQVDDFIATLFIHLNDNTKFDFLSKILSDFKENYWKNKKMHRIARRKLNSFILAVFKKYIDSKSKTDDDLFSKKFSTVVILHFNPTEVFEELVIISFMKFKGETVDKYSKFLIDINNDFVKTFGQPAVYALADVVKDSIMPYLFKTESDKIQLCYFAFKNKRSLDDYLLITKLLPKREPVYTEDFKLYNEIVADLEQVTDISIQLQFNLYLKSQNSEQLTQSW